jgi:ankyrin repeat protein
VVKILLDAGADVNAKDNTGRSAADYATGNNHSDVVKVLKAHRAME